MLSGRQATGRVRIQLFGRSYTATWRVVSGTVEITSALGVGSVLLGGLASAPSIAAAEKLREMALQANRSTAPKPDKGRFNIRDA
jgi:ABC-type taurine transport system substrate-binding protein